MFDLEAKIKKLKTLFTEHDRIENEIAAVLSEGFINSGEIRKLRKQRGHKPKEDHPWLSNKTRGRKKKIRNYICSDCGKPFTTNLPPSIARCINCKSKDVKEREINGEVVESTIEDN